MWIEGCWNSKPLIGQPRLGDALDFERAQIAAQIVISNGITGVADTRWVDEIGCEDALSDFVLKRSVAQPHLLAFGPTLRQCLQRLKVLWTCLTPAHCRCRLLDMTGHQGRFILEDISQLFQHRDDMRIMLVAMAREEARSQIQRQHLVIRELDLMERTAAIEYIPPSLLLNCRTHRLHQHKVTADRADID